MVAGLICTQDRVTAVVMFTVIFALTVANVLFAGQNSEQDTQIMQTNGLEIREIGMPVRSVEWVWLHPGRNREGIPRIYSVMGGQYEDNLFVLQIDPETGELRQFFSDVPNSKNPTSTFMTRDGILYIGAAYCGRLLRFDPDKEVIEDLGAINSAAVTFPCQIDEDAEGRIWIGSYPTADLTCYDPKTDAFIRYGRMDEEDVYNYPLVNTDGTIACMIRMAQQHVVVLDPDTREKQTVGPIIPRSEGYLDLQRRSDGRLYLISDVGEFRKYLLDGTQAIPMDVIGEPMPKIKPLPDGTTFGWAEDQRLYRKLEVKKPNGETRIFDLEYEAGGVRIFYLHAGPDGSIYGGVYPMANFFRYDPVSGDMADLGKGGSAAEVYSMANLNGKIYMSSYPHSLLAEYDPDQPVHFGDKPGDNPLNLGPIDNISSRPRSTLAGPLGRVWLASRPKSGIWGGPLAYYDPETGEKKSYQLSVDLSCYTLAHLEEQKLIAIGTTIAGGTGTQPKVDQAKLYLWDYMTEEVSWEGSLDRPISEFRALVTGPDGKLYGTVYSKNVPSELFVFDPEIREFTHRLALPPGNPLIHGLQNGPDGRLYGFTDFCIYRLNPSSMVIEVLIQDDFTIAGPLLGRNIYFATGVHLGTAAVLQDTGIIGVETTQTVNEGSSFSAAIVATDAVNLAGFQLDVIFNPDVLQAAGIEDGTFLPQDGGNYCIDSNIDNAAGKITGIACARMAQGGADGSIALAVITFRAIGVGESYIRLQNVVMSNPNGDPIPVIVSDGSVTVVELPPWDINKDGTVDINDLILVGEHFGERITTPLDPNPDVNGDGLVNILDLVLVAQHFGETYSPGAPSRDIWSFDVKYLPVLVKLYNAIEDIPSSDRDFLFTKRLLHTIISGTTIARTKVFQNYPNPFNPETWIPYQLADGSEVTVRIYSVTGKLVKQIDLGYKEFGLYVTRDTAARWDGRTDAEESVSSGIYFYTIQAGRYIATKKMIVAR